MSVKPTTAEEEFFIREEAEKLKRLAEQKNQKVKEEEKESLKKLHWMRCPKCGMELSTIEHRGVSIDKCFGCQGMFLDAGELETLAGDGNSRILKTIVDLFK